MPTNFTQLNNLKKKECRLTDLLLLLLFSLIAVSVICVLNINSPYPANDEYAYYSSVVKTLGANSPQLTNVQAACYVPVLAGVLIAKVFGLSYFHLRLMSFCALYLACLVFYLILRGLKISPLLAILLAVTSFFHPVSLNLGCHFMTDAVTNYFILVFLGLILLGLKMKARLPFYLSQIFAVLTVFSRQHFFIICLVYPYLFARQRGKSRAADFIWLLPCSLSFWMAHGLMSVNCSATAVSFMGRLATIIKSAFCQPINFIQGEFEFFAIGVIYLGIFCACQIILSFPNCKSIKTKWSFPAGFCILSAVGILGFCSLMAQRKSYPFLLNIIDLPRVGVVNIIGVVPPVWRDSTMLWMISVIGLILGLIGIWLIIRNFRKFPKLTPEKIFIEGLAVLTVLLFLETVLMTQVQALDRYYYCVLMPVSIIFAVSYSRLKFSMFRLIAILLIMAISISYGLLANLDYWRFINARNVLIKSAFSKGYLASEIDAGPEFDFSVTPLLLSKIKHMPNGNAEFPLSVRGNYHETARQRWWAIVSERCIITTYPVEGFNVLDHISYRASLANSKINLFLLNRD